MVTMLQHTMLLVLPLYHNHLHAILSQLLVLPVPVPVPGTWYHIGGSASTVL